MKRIVGIVLLCALGYGLMAQTQRIEHKVRWMENIFIIAKKYKTDPQTILDYNRITADEVKRGVVLYIPIVEEETRDPEVTNRDAWIDVATPFNPNDCLHYRPYPGITHLVSLILPFNLNEELPNSQFLEFYQGFLLAAEELKEEGLGVRLSVYDQASYPNIYTLVQSGVFRNEELIIGPVYAQDIFELLRSMAETNVSIVSPLDPKTEQAVETHPHFFQVYPSLYWQQHNLLQYIEVGQGPVCLFYESGGGEEELLSTTRQLLMQRNIPYREFSYKVAKDQDITGQLARLLLPYANNQVVVASSNEPFVSDLLRNLHLMQTMRQCPVTLFGNARWRNFENIDLNHYHRMNLHLSVPNYVDYEELNVKYFLSRYRALFRTEPSAYAYQGYDVGHYFLRALYTKGPSFDHCVESIYAQPLQSNFRFQKTNPYGGFTNTDTRIIRYLPDYRVERVH